MSYILTFIIFFFIKVKLSFDEVLVWKKIILMIPKSRISELHFILRSIPDSEILLMRRQGRIVWETYLSSFQCVIDTIVAAVRDRLGIPPLAVHDEPAPSVFNSTFIVMIKNKQQRKRFR